jgi:hypothetical protein
MAALEHYTKLEKIGEGEFMFLSPLPYSHIIKAVVTYVSVICPS